MTFETYIYLWEKKIRIYNIYWFGEGVIVGCHPSGSVALPAMGNGVNLHKSLTISQPAVRLDSCWLPQDISAITEPFRMSYHSGHC